MLYWISLTSFSLASSSLASSSSLSSFASASSPASWSPSSSRFHYPPASPVPYPDHTSTTHYLSVFPPVTDHRSASDDTDCSPLSAIADLPYFDVDPSFPGFHPKQTSLPVDRFPFASVAEYKLLSPFVRDSPATVIKEFQSNLSSSRS